MYSRLLTEVFKFISQYLSQREVPPPILKLYRAVLRLILIMLHDFPDFICNFYYTLCDAISINCLQLRNLILSAFPRSMSLPCPFESNRHAEFIANLEHSPKISHAYFKILSEFKIDEGLKNFLVSPDSNSNSAFLPYLRERLSHDGQYNTSIINAVVIFVGQKATDKISPHVNKQTTADEYNGLISNMPHAYLFNYLITNLDDEGRYLVIGSMVNHLRYPNNHTHYFSQMILNIFQVILKLLSNTILFCKF